MDSSNGFAQGSIPNISVCAQKPTKMDRFIATRSLAGKTANMRQRHHSTTKEDTQTSRSLKEALQHRMESDQLLMSKSAVTLWKEDHYPPCGNELLHARQEKKLSNLLLKKHLENTLPDSLQSKPFSCRNLLWDFLDVAEDEEISVSLQSWNNGLASI
nr:MAG: hypothetical protein [Owegonang virus 16]